MALGINFSAGSGGGDILPYCKYDARAGRLSRIDYMGGENTAVDISKTFKAVMDLENIEIGWLNFSSGGAPDMAVSKFGTPMPAQPTPEHKQGVRLLMKLGKDCGGDVRELSSSAKAFLRGLDDLHSQYLEGVKANPGKLPVVSLKDTVPVTTGEGARKSTNYVPVWELVSWVSRPADLQYQPKARAVAAAPSTASFGGPPSTGSTQMAPPSAGTAQDSEDDFG